jgi:heme A synthase
MKTKLAYFNLIFIVGYFGIEFGLGSTDWILAIGLISTLWYNWETLKRLKGQPSNLNRSNILVGIIVLLFAALMTAEGYHKIIIRDQMNNLTAGLLFLAATQIMLGFSNLLLTAKTINIYWKAKVQ